MPGGRAEARAIYRALLARLGATQACLFIDDKAENVAAARVAAWIDD